MGDGHRRLTDFSTTCASVVYGSNAVLADNKLSVSGEQQAATVRCSGKNRQNGLLITISRHPLWVEAERNEREKL